MVSLTGRSHGVLWPGCKNIDEVIVRLREAESSLTDPDAPLLAWGLDPIYFAGERLIGSHLDQVSKTTHFCSSASAHLATVNCFDASRGITSEIPMEGIPKDAEGNPIGELQEPAASL